MKYEVEAGAFVTVLRSRKLIIYADNEAEAAAKAVEKFQKLFFDKGQDCGSVHVDSIKAVE